MMSDTSFFDQLERRTRPERDALLELPFVRAALDGTLPLETYVAFLTQAYHHVRHTVPLLMAVGAELGEGRGWLRNALCDYVAEERGHDEWILGDLAACGADAESVRRGSPDLPCELMVAYAYDVIRRRSPLGLLGMVHVLEGTSVRAATRAAEALRHGLGLPAEAFTYLTTHGELDRDHVGFFASLVNRLQDEPERQLVVHCSRVFTRLYGDIFRALLPAPRLEDASCPTTPHASC